MREIYRTSSTNGRWGLVLVADVIEDIDVEFPIRGTLIPLGTIEGFSVYRVIMDENVDTYIGAFGEAEVLEGGVVVETMDLQSYNYVTLVTFGKKAIIKIIGYKGRSSSVILYCDGKRQQVPASVMLALGLTKVKEEIIPIPKIPPVSSVMEDALRKAGFS